MSTHRAFGAALTTLVLALVLVTGSGWLLAAQAVVFAIGALAGLERAPYGLVRALVAPRLPRPRELEAEAPPRFAPAVGLVFAVVGTAATCPASPRAGSSPPPRRSPPRSATQPSASASAATGLH